MTSTSVLAADSAKPPKKHHFSVPSAFTILFLLTVLVVGLTWVIPAGSYAKLTYVAADNKLNITSPTGEVTVVEPTQAELQKIGVGIEIDKFTSGAIKKPISIPDTYQRLEQKPAGLFDIPASMVNGTIEVADIMVFIFVLGGLIGVVKKTGAFETGLYALTKATKGREFLLVLTVALLMMAGGTSCGLEEEAVAFYPILCPIFIAMGYDAIVCVGAIFLAASMGTTFATINPFSSVIASNAAGINFMEGMTWRVVGLIGGAIATSVYLWWYARKVKANPEFSYAYDDREKFAAQWNMASEHPGKFTWRHMLILTLFVLAFPLMVWGVMTQGWWFPLMAASFLSVALIVIFLAATGGLSEAEITDAFTEGASKLVGVSLIIGLARGINIIMTDGLISDTVLHSLVGLVGGMPKPLFVIAAMLIFFVLGFLVPSSSGLAVLSMPIMAPLADSVGVHRETLVMAYQWGQYAMLYLAPTGLVMATLQMLDMKYTNWVRFVWPMVAFVLGFGGILLVTQTFI